MQFINFQVLQVRAVPAQAELFFQAIMLSAQAELFFQAIMLSAQAELFLPVRAVPVLPVLYL